MVMRRFIGYFLVVLASMLLCGGTAYAHKPADSYLRLKIDKNTIEGTWDVALLDLEATAKLNANDDIKILKNFALQHLSVSTDSKPCILHIDNIFNETITDSTIRIKGECPVKINEITIDYSQMLSVDMQYRGLVFIKAGNNDYTSALSAENPYSTFKLNTSNQWQQFKDYLCEGIFHILTGYDHILFLVSLLLSAPFILKKGEWRPCSDGFRSAFLQVLKIVTAFTIAHSITLGLVIFDVISLPSRLVESTIALSIAIASANNLYPIMHRRLWILTFCFGLIHGMGFADALRELGLPENARWLALMAFNLGVEIGQVSIVLLTLLAIYLMRHNLFYRYVALRIISLSIIAIALVWFTQRAFAITLLKGMFGA